VPLDGAFGLEKIKGNIICNLPFSNQMAGEHVTFDVFAKKVLITKHSRVNHPHSHLKTPAIKPLSIITENSVEKNVYRPIKKQDRIYIMKPDEIKKSAASLTGLVISFAAILNAGIYMLNQ
jgi:calcineurin-like phosphoesterase family protein